MEGEELTLNSDRAPEWKITLSSSLLKCLFVTPEDKSRAYTLSITHTHTQSVSHTFGGTHSHLIMHPFTHTLVDLIAAGLYCDGVHKSVKSGGAIVWI